MTHEHLRDSLDLTTKYTFAGILLACLKAVGYFKQSSENEITPDEIMIGKQILTSLNSCNNLKSLCENVIAYLKIKY